MIAKFIGVQERKEYFAFEKTVPEQDAVRAVADYWKCPQCEVRTARAFLTTNGKGRYDRIYLDSRPKGSREVFVVFRK